MFTGIVQHSGRLRGFAKGKTELLVEAPGLPVEIGGSVAVDARGIRENLIQSAGGH